MKIPFNKSRLTIFFIYALCFVVIAGAGLYFRLYPHLYHASSDAHERATLFVLSKLKNTAALQIQKRFPQATDFEKRNLAQKGFDEILHKNSNQVKASIDKVAREIDKKEGRLSIPYLLEADSYNFFRLTRNILTTGRISDTFKGSKYFNKLMLAPFGHFEPLTLHPYVGYLVYKAVNFLSPGIPLMFAISFTPLVTVILSLVMFLFLCRLLECGHFPALIGGLFLLLSPIYLKRSAFGWYDNDPYNIFFPLLILSFLFLGLKEKGRLARAFSYGILASFTMSLYALFWQGWVYLLGVIFTSSIIIVAYSFFVLKDKKETKNLCLYLGVVNLGSFLWVSLFFGINDFFVLFNEGYSALKNFLTPQFSSWPDVFLGVGELRRAPLLSLVSESGGLPYLFLAFCGIAIFSFKFFRRNANPFLYIVIAVLFVFSGFMALGAQRFALLAVLPFGILFTVGVNGIFEFPLKFAKSRKFKGVSYRLGIRLLSIVFFIMLLIYSVIQAHKEMLAWRPIYNETWDKVMTKIRTETPQESIINSWWPPGHFITSMGKRPVLFDGATINNPQAYWMAHLLLSPDEKYAAGLLWMLGNSANLAIDFLAGQGMSLSLAVKTVKDIAVLSRGKAEEFLAQKTSLKKEQAEKLLHLTHHEPPPSYVLIYNDLIEKNLELSFVGKWNFEKVEWLQGSAAAQKRIPPPNSREYIQFLWDLADGPLNYSELYGQTNRQGSMVFFPEGIRIDTSEMTCEISGKKFGAGIPKSIIYADENGVAEKVLPKANRPFSVLLLKDNRSYSCMVLDDRLAKSVLFRLYFFDGKGLKYFEPFTKETDLTGRTRIVVFRVNREKFLKDLE